MTRESSIKLIALGLILSFSVHTGLAQDAKEETKEDPAKQDWANTNWKKINSLTKQKRSFQVEKATTVAGVRGSEAEDNLLKQLYYRGGTKYPSRLELKNAIDLLEKDIRLDPYASGVAENKFFIGQCYVQLNEREKALEAFEDILKDFPDSEYAVQAKDEMAKLKKK